MLPIKPPNLESGYWMADVFYFKTKYQIMIVYWLVVGCCLAQENGWEDPKEKLPNSLYYFMGKGLLIPLQESTLWLIPEEKILTLREKRKNLYIEPLHGAKSLVRKNLKTPHQQLALDPALLSPSAKTKLLSQLQPFFPSERHQRIQTQLSGTKSFLVDVNLLPPFAAAHVKRFSIYRGPNCFHSAIAFAYPDMVDSDLLNPRREKFYHSNMLNGDEILRVLSFGFYPLHRVDGLQYGDILIFLEKSSNPRIPLHLKIKHAMVYLFSDYVFSKASKSADSPYRIEKLEVEWKIWGQLQDLEIKVFRKKPVHGTTLSSFVPYDWRS